MGIVVAMFRLSARQCIISLTATMACSLPYTLAEFRIVMPLLWQPVLISFVALCKQGMLFVVGSADLVLESVSNC
jgi:hypothetical protein